MLRSTVVMVLIVGNAGSDSNSPTSDIVGRSIAGFCCMLLLPQL